MSGASAPATAGGRPAVTVFLVDDHELARRGIAQFLESDAQLRVVGEAGTAALALPRILATRPDVAVLDLNLPDGDGVTLCAAVRAALPETRCIILTALESDEARARALAAGAVGFLLKDVRAAGLIEQVKKAARGEVMRTAFAPAAPARPAATRAEDSALRSLTTRERSILDLVADGHSNREIGQRLQLAEKTIKNNVTSVLAKLGLSNRTQASAYLWRERAHPDSPR